MEKKGIMGQAGASLVEVIIAMLILALLVTGLNMFVVNVVNTNLASKELSAATAAGNQLLENLRRDGYTQAVSGSDVVGSKYIRTWMVTNDGTKKSIRLTVVWPPSTGKKSIQLSTIIARPNQ